jgi:hypothetical protein
MSYSRTRFFLIVGLTVLVTSFTSTTTIADGENNGQAKKIHASFVVADAYGDLIGPVLRYWNGNGITVQLNMDGIDTLAFLNRRHGFGTSWPPGPMLFFQDPECQGQAYARIEHVEQGWMSPTVVIAPGIVPGGGEPSAERIPYFIETDEPGHFTALSLLEDNGQCHPFGPPEIHVWPVKQIRACDMSHDLNTCYPPPYELDLR